MFTIGALGTQPYPCALNDIPSWRPQDAEPVVTAAAHQCRAHRGPRPAEPHPCSPAVRTGDRECRLRHRFTARQLKLGVGVGGGRDSGCKAGPAGCSTLPCLGSRRPCPKSQAPNPHPCPSPLSPPLGQMRTAAHNPSPHQTRSRSLESGQSKHLVE